MTKPRGQQSCPPYKTIMPYNHIKNRNISAICSIRHYSALSGLCVVADSIPRALPWADIFRPFRAKYRHHIWLKYYQKQRASLKMRFTTNKTSFLHLSLSLQALIFAIFRKPRGLRAHPTNSIHNQQNMFFTPVAFAPGSDFCNF